VGPATAAGAGMQARALGFLSASNPHELLDYGAAQPVMKMFFERAHKELESKLPRPIGSRFESLVVMR
jgi:hypothetical protein